MVQGGMSVVKYLMFIFNFVFTVCGLALVIVGGLAYSSGADYERFLGTKYNSAAALVIAVGVIIFFIAALGCYGAIRENHCMIATFGVLMFLIFIAEVAGGITAYVYRNDMKDFLEKGMNESFKERYDSLKNFWDDMEHSMECCGVKTFEQYNVNKTSTFNLPSSCCKEYKTCTSSDTDIFKEGCAKKLEDFFSHKVAVIGGIGFGIAAVEVLGMLFAWCLAVAIKKEYEGV